MCLSPRLSFIDHLVVLAIDRLIFRWSLGRLGHWSIYLSLIGVRHQSLSAIDRLLFRWSVSAIDHFRLIIKFDDWASLLLWSLPTMVLLLCPLAFVHCFCLMLRHLWEAIAMGLEIATRWVIIVGHDGRISQPLSRCWHRWCRPWPLMVICCRPWPQLRSL